jgi:hypothetical protein
MSWTIRQPWFLAVECCCSAVDGSEEPWPTDNALTPVSDVGSTDSQNILIFDNLQHLFAFITRTQTPNAYLHGCHFLLSGKSSKLTTRVDVGNKPFFLCSTLSFGLLSPSKSEWPIQHAIGSPRLSKTFENKTSAVPSLTESDFRYCQDTSDERLSSGTHSTSLKLSIRVQVVNGIMVGPGNSALVIRHYFTQASESRMQNLSALTIPILSKTHQSSNIQTSQQLNSSHYTWAWETNFRDGNHHSERLVICVSEDRESHVIRNTSFLMTAAVNCPNEAGLLSGKVNGESSCIIIEMIPMTRMMETSIGHGGNPVDCHSFPEAPTEANGSMEKSRPSQKYSENLLGLSSKNNQLDQCRDTQRDNPDNACNEPGGDKRQKRHKTSEDQTFERKEPGSKSFENKGNSEIVRVIISECKS